MDTLTQKSGYAPINGLDLYYEISGAGFPLVLLHGGLGGTVMFAQFIPALSENHQVIAVDLQAHSHTADIDRPLSYELMGDDIAALLNHLGIEKADILGYSLGGGVALRTTIQHPELVRKLVLVSTVFKRQGWYPQSQEGMASMNGAMAEFFKGTPPYDNYMNTAPRPDGFPDLLTKMGNMLGQEYDWTAEVAKITAPALIVLADADGIMPAHALEMYQLFGGGKADVGVMDERPASQFAVIPDALHWNILDHSELLLPMFKNFLAAPLPEGKESTAD